jgi:6-phosphogluconolactonase
MNRWSVSLAFLSCFLSLPLSADGLDVYFGTYTSPDGSKGIYRASFDPETGNLGEPALAAELPSPSFLTIDAAGKHVYAVSEVGGPDGGRVTAFRIDESGGLVKINDQPSGGNGPCHISLSPDGATLLVANYGGGSVASYRVGKDGSISAPVSVIRHQGSSVNPKRQKEPHAHSINASPDGRFAHAADLGTDRIHRYAIDPSTGALAPAGEAALAPGSGPRHFTFRPDGRFAYVINELLLNVTAFRVDPGTGTLTEIQTLSTLPDGTKPVGSTAEVVCHPKGRFLYGSNRGHDSIVVYAIDESTGKLTRVENESLRGKVPRNFAITPDGGWLLAAGQESGTVEVLRLDPATGALEPSGSPIRVDRPVCIRFVRKP